MKSVKIGPKSYKSSLPVGYVDIETANMVQLADSGQMPQQYLDFHLMSKKNGLPAYQRAYVINGASRFKVYNALDTAFYKLTRTIMRIKNIIFKAN